MLRLEELTAGAKAKMKAMKKRSKAALATVQTSAQQAISRAEAAEVERDQLRAQLAAALCGGAGAAGDSSSDAVVVDAAADNIGSLLARRVRSGDLTVDDAAMLRASLAAMEAQLAAGAITPSEFLQIKTTCFEGVRTGVLVETPTSTPTAARQALGQAAAAAEYSAASAEVAVLVDAADGEGRTFEDEFAQTMELALATTLSETQSFAVVRASR